MGPRQNRRHFAHILQLISSQNFQEDFFFPKGAIDLIRKSHNSFHITWCTIQNRKQYIYILNGALWDMEEVNYGICEISVLSIIIVSGYGLEHIIWQAITWPNDDPDQLHRYAWRGLK